MAKASAKKAAAAKDATAKLYQPLLIISNIIYLVLLFGRSGGGGGKIEFPSWNLIGIILTWALQIYSYFGILHQATLTSSSKSKKDLVGGQHLDWLGLTLVVQFSTAMHSTKWFWLLLIWPIVSGWSLYTSMFGKSSPKSSSSNMAENSTSASNSNSSSSSRREKRAEKRRQKWS